MDKIILAHKPLLKVLKLKFWFNIITHNLKKLELTLMVIIGICIYIIIKI